MKINAQLIQQSRQFTNALKERQLDLKGYLSLSAAKLIQIQNLGATLDYFDCIDLSDNQIKKLGNVTYLSRQINNDRLKTLILTNNKIDRIQDISQELPNLQNLCLLNNRINNVSEVIKLSSCKKLERLILINNAVPNYRLEVIYNIPQLRILDFQKITKSQRIQAEKMFGKVQK